MIKMSGQDDDKGSIRTSAYRKYKALVSLLGFTPSEEEFGTLRLFLPEELAKPILRLSYTSFGRGRSPLPGYGLISDFERALNSSWYMIRFPGDSNSKLEELAQVLREEYD